MLYNSLIKTGHRMLNLNTKADGDCQLLFLLTAPLDVDVL